MSFNKKLSPVDILSVAIKSEIHAADLYNKIRDGVKNKSLIEKLDFLAKEEVNHRKMLEGMFKKQFPDVKLELPDESLLPNMEVALKKDTSVPELLKKAMEAEEAAEEFYKEQAKLSDNVNSKKMLKFLSNMERGHYHLLKNEYEILEQFPEYYKVEDFHFGDEFMHVGP